VAGCEHGATSLNNHSAVPDGRSIGWSCRAALRSGRSFGVRTHVADCERAGPAGERQARHSEAGPDLVGNDCRGLRRAVLALVQGRRRRSVLAASAAARPPNRTAHHRLVGHRNRAAGDGGSWRLARGAGGPTYLLGVRPVARYDGGFAKRSVRRDRGAEDEQQLAEVHAAPKAQPARKRSGTRTAGSRELWRAARRGSARPTEGVRRGTGCA